MNFFESHKKIILITIVSIEIIIGGIFIWKYLKNHSLVSSTETNKIARLSKDALVFADHPRFKYYFSLKPNVVQEVQPDWLPYKAVYTHNLDGLHERFDYAIAKTPNTVRIVTLGDSFTFGEYVSTADNWTEKLENTLNQQSAFCGKHKFEVINLGMSSFDIPYIIERYLTIGEKYQPDIIVWLEAGSGFARHNEFMRPLIETCEQAKPTLSPDTPQVDTYYQCWNQASKQLVDDYPPTQFAELLAKDFDLFFTKVEPSHFFMITFQISAQDKRSAEILSYYRQRYPQAHFESVIPDLKPDESLPDRHPNVQGHTQIAGSIFKYLKRNALNDAFTLCQ